VKTLYSKVIFTKNNLVLIIWFLCPFQSLFNTRPSTT